MRLSRCAPSWVIECEVSSAPVGIPSAVSKRKWRKRRTAQNECDEMGRQRSADRIEE